MQTIEIRTTQNVTIEYELASLRDRILAYFIDFMIVMVAYAILVAILSATIQAVINSSGLNANFVYYLLPMFLFIFYQLFMEIFNNGQSIGKKALNVKVIRLDGKEPGLSDYLLRAVLLIVDTWFCFGVVASLLIGSTAKRQRFGDLTANTTVVRLQSKLQISLNDVLKIDSLHAYEPQYPEIRQMREKDMLMIKNAIARYQKHPNKAHREAISELIDRLVSLLELEERPRNGIEFLKTLIRDYIVLTR